MEQNRFTNTAAAARPVTYDAGLRAHFLRVYNIMTFGLVLTGFTAFATSQIPAMVGFLDMMRGNMLTGMLLAFSPMFLLMFAFNPASINRFSANKLTIFFALFSAYFGWLFSTIFLAYTAESIARVFFITAAMFAATSIYGYTTKRDLTSMGSFLFMGAVGLMIAIVVNMFLQSSMLHFAISGIGVVLYTAMIAFDTQNIKQAYYQAGQFASKAAVLGALSLYMNFIMLFQFLMQFMGNRE
jgi:FtsH-binding integral membrane protein